MLRGQNLWVYQDRYCSPGQNGLNKMPEEDGYLQMAISSLQWHCTHDLHLVTRSSKLQIDAKLSKICQS